MKKIQRYLSVCVFIITGILSGASTTLADMREEKLSRLLLGGKHPVRSSYQPNKIHAGIDFGNTGTNITSVKSPVNGTIIANTSACGKVAIFDGKNTVILAHMSNRTSLPIGKMILVGDYVGKAAKVLGGGCSATGPHLHIEVRTGRNPTMALPTNDNRKTTLNPTEYIINSEPSIGDDNGSSQSNSLLNFKDSSINPFLNSNGLRLVCNPQPPYTELPSRREGNVVVRQEKVVPLVDYLSSRCETGKQNPLLLLIGLTPSGDLDLNGLKQGNISGGTFLKETLIGIFTQRKQNEVYWAGTNRVITPITIKVPQKINREIFVKTLELLRMTGTESVNVYVEG